MIYLKTTASNWIVLFNLSLLWAQGFNKELFLKTLHGKIWFPPIINIFIHPKKFRLTQRTSKEYSQIMDTLIFWQKYRWTFCWVIKSFRSETCFCVFLFDLHYLYQNQWKFVLKLSCSCNSFSEIFSWRSCRNSHRITTDRR